MAKRLKIASSATGIGLATLHDLKRFGTAGSILLSPLGWNASVLPFVDFERTGHVIPLLQPGSTYVPSKAEFPIRTGHLDQYFPFLLGC